MESQEKKRKDYNKWNEFKDLASIYHEFEWRDADVIVWNPKLEKEYKLTFCGSTRPDDDNNGKINFIISEIDGKDIDTPTITEMSEIFASRKCKCQECWSCDGDNTCAEFNKLSSLYKEIVNDFMKNKLEKMEI